jgi:FkbM family methyltransferase
MFSNVGPVGAKNLSLNLEELVQKYQVKIKGLIHIGAHYGQEYEIYQKLGLANLIFFEPLRQNFEILKTHVGDKAKLFQLALGNENKKVKMYVESANNGMSSSILKPQKHLELYPQIVFDQQEIVEMVRLYDFFTPKKRIIIQYG